MTLRTDRHFFSLPHKRYMIRNRACENFSLGIRQQDREFLQRTRQRAIQDPDGWHPGENKRAVPRRRHLNQNFLTKKHKGGSNFDHTIRTCSICAMALRNSAASWAALGFWAWSMHRTSIHTTVSRPSFSVLGQHYARVHVSIRKKRNHLQNLQTVPIVSFQAASCEWHTMTVGRPTKPPDRCSCCTTLPLTMSFLRLAK